MVTIFQNFADTTTPHYIQISEALARIKNGRSKERVELIRGGNDKLKLELPCVLFSGKFSKRNNVSLIEHSGFIVLDFDSTPPEYKEELKKFPFIYSAWISPSGTGVKALAKISNPKYHRQHFLALETEFPNLDKSGKDVARICFESYDPDLWINENVIPYDSIIDDSKTIYSPPAVAETNEEKIYGALKRSAEKRGELFTEGSRNLFIMKMAAACNRTGISQDAAKLFLSADATFDSGFRLNELTATVDKVYKMYGAQFGQYPLEAKVEKTEFKDKVFDSVDIPIEDVIYFNDCFEDLLKLRRNGPVRGETTHIEAFNNNFRWMKTEVTCWHGYGGHGKTAFVLFLHMLRAKFEGKKLVSYSPENFPPHYFYADLLQMWGGASIDKTKPLHLTDEEINIGKDFINETFIYVYPEKKNPTPDNILKQFQEVISKHKVESVLVDPFNMLDHHQERLGMRDDVYLGEVLADFKRFAQQYNVYFNIIAHPKATKKNDKGGYDVPTSYDLAGGPMWTNRCDNIICYNRPMYFEDPFNPTCDLHIQKIKKNGINGGPGMVEFTYDRSTFSFSCRGVNPMNPTVAPVIAKSNPNIFIESRRDEEENTSPF